MARTIVLLLAAAVACGDAPLDPDASLDAASSDGGSDRMDVGVDAGGPDAPSVDALPLDAGLDAMDAVDAGAPDSGEDESMVFVAVGNAGRHLRSLDDGLTWVDDEADADGVLCTRGSRGEGFCFEGDRSVRGAAYANGFFFAAYGWAREPTATNSLRRSRDGALFESILEPGGFGDVAAGGGWVVATGRSGTSYVMVSEDDGDSWRRVPSGYGDWANMRRAEYVPARGGLFVVVGDGNGFAMTIGDGDRFTVPSHLPEACTGRIELAGGIASIDDRILVAWSDGRVCVSDDGGDRWRATDGVGARITSVSIVATEDELQLWSADFMHSSSDGIVWERHRLSSDVRIGPVARNPSTGTYVAVSAGYLNGYDAQEFYRSDDGLEWETLDASSASRSHPIREIVVGATSR